MNTNVQNLLKVKLRKEVFTNESDILKGIFLFFVKIK